MAVAGSTGMEHLSFAERPGYGDPHPEGIAVAHAALTGDATGGTVGMTFLADGGFLYRLELANSTQGDATTSQVHAISSHDWATAKSPAPPGAFNLNWVFQQRLADIFRVHTLDFTDYQQIRRFPIGRTQNVQLQTVFQMTNDDNTDTIIYEFDLVMSYWRKEAWYRPGFLSSFYDSPFIPLVQRGP